MPHLVSSAADKQALRSAYKAQRAGLPMTSLSQAVVKTLAREWPLCLPQHAQVNPIAVLGYAPTGSEVNMLPWLQALMATEGYHLFLPRIATSSSATDATMTFWPYTAQAALQASRFGILEPLPQHQSQAWHAEDYAWTIMLLPALAIDASGYRLGYGKGYYDRFLANNVFAGPKVGITVEALFRQPLPVDAWDRPCTMVCTEAALYSL